MAAVGGGGGSGARVLDGDAGGGGVGEGKWRNESGRVGGAVLRGSRAGPWSVGDAWALVGGTARPGPSAGEMVLGLGRRANWCWALVGRRNGAGPWSAGEMVLGYGQFPSSCWKERNKEETEFVSAWLPGGDLGGS